MSFIFSTRLASFWRHASTRMPCLVRRVDPLFHPPPCLDSSFLPFLLRLICLSSSFLSCLSSSALPRFHLPSPTPDRLSSISPLHVGGSGRLAKQTARTSRWFDWSVIKTLVSCTVCLNHCLEQAQMKYLRINYIHSIKRETVETIQIFCKILYDRRRSLPTIAKFQLVWPQSAIFVFQLPTTKAHKWFPWGVNVCVCSLLNRSFYPSTSSTPSLRVDSSS